MVTWKCLRSANSPASDFLYVCVCVSVFECVVTSAVLTTRISLLTVWEIVQKEHEQTAS